MSATAASLVDYVMPKVALRQWVPTFPFAWRMRLAFNGALLGALVRKFADAVLALYKAGSSSPSLAVDAVEHDRVQPGAQPNASG